MPVPLSVTHPKGAGLQAAKPATLPTEGPFARLARMKAEQEAAAAAAANGAAAGGAAAQDGAAAAAARSGDAAPGPGSAAAGSQPGAAAAPGSSSSGSGPSILVQHLDFSYPGLGEQPRRAASVWPACGARPALQARSLSRPAAACLAPLPITYCRAAVTSKLDTSCCGSGAWCAVYHVTPPFNHHPASQTQTHTRSLSNTSRQTAAPSPGSRR